MSLRAQIYQVQTGDSLSLISKKIYGDFSYVDQIAKLNNIANKNLIQPGQQLVMPEAVSSKTAVMATDADVVSTTKTTTSTSVWKQYAGKAFPWVVVAVAAILLGREAMKQKKKNAAAKKSKPAPMKVAA